MIKMANVKINLGKIQKIEEALTGYTPAQIKVFFENLKILVKNAKIQGVIK